MKSFIAALVLFAVLVAGGIFFVEYIDDISEQMLAQNTEITSLIENERFSEAKPLVKKLSEFIEQKRAIILTTMDHSYVDTIELYICELEKYVEYRGKSDALAKSNVLNKLFKNLPRNYKLKWENIF